VAPTITHPFFYPRAILAKKWGASMAEVELFIASAGGPSLVDLRRTGEYEWVRPVTMSFWDDERGAPLDLRIPSPALPFDEQPQWSQEVLQHLRPMRPGQIDHYYGY
jgi:hypothetical protein